MGRAKDTEGRFVLTLKLRFNRAAQKRLDKMFAAANNLYNNMVEEQLRRLKALQETPEWIAQQESLEEIWQKYRDLAETRDLTEQDLQAKKKEEKPIYDQRNKMLSEAKFSQYGFQNMMKHHKKQFGFINNGNIWSSLLPNDVCQAISGEVWQKFEKYLYGNGKTIKFRSIKDCKTLNFLGGSVKFDGRNIVFPSKGLMNRKSADNRARIRAAKKGNKDLWAVDKGIPEQSFGRFLIPVKFQRNDYECQALANWEHDLCYCSLVREASKTGWLYKVQITLKGEPPVLIDENACIKHPLGKGKVGIDINLRNVAVVGERGILFEALAPGAGTQKQQKQLDNLQKKRDRLFRLCNVEHFKEDGQVIHANILAKEHPELVRIVEDQEGNLHHRHIWKKTKHLLKIENRIRYIHGKAARIRKKEHNELANRIMAMGDEFYIEPMDWREMAKKAEYVEPPKGEKAKTTKRYGKSISEKSGGLFVSILKRKVETKGGSFKEVNHYSCKASQYNHIDQTYTKCEPDVRIKQIGDFTVQRDLYSAFLLRNVNEELAGFDQNALESGFADFLVWQEMAMNNLPEFVPGSMGKAGWESNNL